MRKKNKDGGITLPDCKLCYKALVIRRVWYWHNNRHIDHWNRRENTEINSHIYGELIFDNDTKSIQWGKDNFCNKWCWEIWISTCKRMQLSHYLTLSQNLTQNWLRTATVKLLQYRKRFLTLVLAMIFLIWYQKQRLIINAQINKWDYFKP